VLYIRRHYMLPLEQIGSIPEWHTKQGVQPRETTQVVPNEKGLGDKSNTCSKGAKHWEGQQRKEQGKRLVRPLDPLL
jgi:hypothetical protein